MLPPCPPSPGFPPVGWVPSGPPAAPSVSAGAACAPWKERAPTGLCPRCWAGLLPLAEERCPRCALVHEEGSCPEPTAWSLGDALWDYHGGRPPLGALLVPGIKQGEAGWRLALLDRLAHAPLPPWTAEVDLVTAAPSTLPRRLLRAFDLGAEAA